MLHKEAIDRIKTVNVPGEGWLDMFQQLVAEATEAQQNGLDLCVGFVEEGDEFVSGDYVPEIHLIIRRVDD